MLAKIVGGDDPWHAIHGFEVHEWHGMDPRAPITVVTRWLIESGRKVADSVLDSLLHKKPTAHVSYSEPRRRNNSARRV
jgi:hypothetical protein